MSETQTTPAATANTSAAPADAPPPMVIPTKKSASGSASFAGDNILPGATVVYDQKKTISAPAEDVWPWLVQWGKGRGGWYVPSKIEKALPEKYRSAPTIDPKWQALRVGDTVPDYGFMKKSKKGGGDAVEYQLEVALIENQRALVYKGHRLGQDFTWALLLETRSGAPAGANGSSAASTASAPECVLHLRFRGQSDQTGWKAKVTEVVGKAADAAMAAAMFPGIADRAEQQVKIASQPAPVSTL